MKLKLLAALSLLPASLLTSSLAIAVDTELKSEGQIIAGSCEISASNAGVYEFGDISQDNLTAASPKEIGDKTQTITITCAAPMYVAMKMADNREGTESTGTNFPSSAPRAAVEKLGLNLDPSQNPIGFWKITLPAQPQVDGSEGRILYSLDSGVTWPGSMRLNDNPLHPNLRFAFAPLASGNTPSPIQIASFDLKGTVYIDAMDKLDLSRGAELDGSVTFELYYL